MLVLVYKKTLDKHEEIFNVFLNFLVEDNDKSLLKNVSSNVYIYLCYVYWNYFINIMLRNVKIRKHGIILMLRWENTTLFTNKSFYLYKKIMSRYLSIKKVCCQRCLRIFSLLIETQSTPGSNLFLVSNSIAQDLALARWTEDL